MEYIPPQAGQMNANATHYGITAALIARTTGAVLELGVGHYSTPLIHYMCLNRRALSVETNKEWCKYFSEMFPENDWHKFYCTNNKLISMDLFSHEKYKDIYWDVALVDNGPSIDRKKCIELLRNKARFIVVHDSEPAAVCYDWGDIFDSFKYHYYWDFYGNGTSVVSETEEVGLE